MQVTRNNPFINLGMDVKYVQAFQFLVDQGVHNNLDK